MTKKAVFYALFFLFSGFLHAQESGLDVYLPPPSAGKTPNFETLSFYAESGVPLAYAKISVYDQSNQIASGYSSKDGTFILFIHDLALYSRKLTVKAQWGSTEKTATAELIKPENRIIRFVDAPAITVKQTLHYCFIVENGPSFSGYSLRLARQLATLFKNAAGPKSWSLIFSSEGKYLFYDKSSDPDSLAIGLTKAFSSSSPAFEAAVPLAVILDGIKTDDCTDKKIIYITSTEPSLFEDPGATAALQILRQRDFSLSLISPMPQKTHPQAGNWLKVLRGKWMVLSSNEKSHSLMYHLGQQKSDRTLGANDFFWTNAASLYKDLAALEGYSLPAFFCLDPSSSAETEEAFSLFSRSFQGLGMKMKFSTFSKTGFYAEPCLELSGTGKNGILTLTLRLKLPGEKTAAYSKDFSLPVP
jgi:hypothetical protein